MKFWKRVFEPFYLSYVSCERTSGFSRTAAPIFLAPHRGATDLGRHFSRFSRWQFPSPCKNAKMASPKCLVLIIELVMAYLELELPKVRQLKWTTLSSWFTTKQWLIWVFHNSTWISFPSPVKSPNFQTLSLSSTDDWLPFFSSTICNICNRGTTALFELLTLGGVCRRLCSRHQLLWRSWCLCDGLDVSQVWMCFLKKHRTNEAFCWEFVDVDETKETFWIHTEEIWNSCVVSVVFNWKAQSKFYIWMIWMW